MSPLCCVAIFPAPSVISERNETRSVIRIKVLHILSFVLSTNRQLYEVCIYTFALLTVKSLQFYVCPVLL